MRPRGLVGLSMRVAAVKRQELAWTVGVLLVLLLIGCLVFRAQPSSVRVATFNIENFPRDGRQVAGAFEAIEATEAPVVAVQEITEPDTFAREARARLGDEWRFVHDDGGNLQRLGVLYDGARFELAYARTHDDPQIEGRGKPLFEVRLRRVSGGRALRVFVVHLKAGGDFAHVRREQLRLLSPRIARAVDSWDEVVLLGDFNATGDADRRELARFAERVGLEWASEPLECTSYWDRTDGCRGSALDHAFTRDDPRDISARGPCESIGCQPGQRCPLFHREVSDHCPVTLDL